MISLLRTLVVCLLGSVCLAAHFVRHERALDEESNYHHPSPFDRRSVDENWGNEEDFEHPSEFARRSLADEEVYHRPQRRSVVYQDKINAQRRRSVDNTVDVPHYDAFGHVIKPQRRRSIESTVDVPHYDAFGHVVKAQHNQRRSVDNTIEPKHYYDAFGHVIPAESASRMTRRQTTNPAANANEWHNAAHNHPSAGADFAHHQHTSGEQHQHEHDRRAAFDDVAAERAHDTADVRSRRHLIMPGGYFGGYGYPAFGYPGFYGGYGYPGYGGLYFRRRREIPQSESSISPVSPVYAKHADSVKSSARSRRSLTKTSPFDRVKTHQRRQLVVTDPVVNAGYIGAPIVGAPFAAGPVVGVDPLLAGGVAPGYVVPGGIVPGAVAPGYIGAPVVGGAMPIGGVL